MTHRIASCSCGQLTAKVSGEPIRVSVCHCYACQRRSGSVFAAQARFPRQAVEISGTGTQYVRVGDEGGGARFTFCPTCGVTVYYINEGREDSIVIPVGVFAESNFPAPTFSVYEERMHSWVSMPEDMEHMA
ncbi:MAG: GFA family protein [Burkholderiaceae bacterium]